MDLQNSPPVTLPPKNKPKKWLRILLIVIISFFGVIVVTAALLFILVYLPAKSFYNQALSLQSDVTRLQTAVDNKDLKDANNQLDSLKTKTNSLSVAYKKFAYLKV
ncbi:MAG: hypothetical protein NTY75_00055, partial [Candidatus Shapirobacteria bacterium]|nr:hypothetical protein [Candidatus Shapirobacteria bacterium]